MARKCSINEESFSNITGGELDLLSLFPDEEVERRFLDPFRNPCVDGYVPIELIPDERNFEPLVEFDNAPTSGDEDEPETLYFCNSLESQKRARATMKCPVSAIGMEV